MITEKLNLEILKNQDDIFKESLMNLVEPPIKGEITKGKLKWRGVRFIQQKVGLNYCSWLEKRGKQITPKLYIEYEQLQRNGKKKDCTRCKFFCSWYDFMGDDDPLEPTDLGKCENKLNDDDKGEETYCGEGDVCELWQYRYMR